MNWVEKARYLKERWQKKDYDKNKYFIDVLYLESKWQENELESILKSYPFVPESYINFIKEFDGSVISFVSFYGSKKSSRFGHLLDAIAELQEYGFSDEYFPFAKDPAGSVFAIAKDGSILYFDIDDYEFENPEKLADSFEEFVGECVLGKKADFHEDSKHYQFLKSLGWVD